MNRLAWLLLLAVSGSAAEPLDRGDFAWGFGIDLRPGSAVYRLDLDDAALRASRHPGHADLVVFNRRGEAVPTAIRAPRGSERVVPEQRDVPFFPLHDGGITDRDGRFSLRVKLDASGAIVEVDSAERSPDLPISRYLLDLSQVAGPVGALRLEWEPSGASRVVPVRLSTSKDLGDWTTLVARATLAELEYEGQRLRQQRIAWRARPLRYLRLESLSGQPLPRLTGAAVAIGQPDREAQRQWSIARGVADALEAGRYQFDFGAYRPIDRLRVGFPQKNTLAVATLWSRDAPEAAWRRRFNGRIYHLETGGAVLQSAPLALPPVSDRFWRLDIDSRGGGIGAGAPDLHAGWLAPELLFVARGEAPFILAVGSARAVPPLLPAQVLIAGQGPTPLEPAGARLLTRHELGGESALQPEPEPVAWRTGLLWAVLLLAVALLAWMARSLYRDLREDETREPDDSEQ